MWHVLRQFYQSYKRYMGFVAILLFLGLGWGFTQPLAKIAAEGGYRGLGMAFWQFVLGVMVLFTVLRVRGGRISVRPMHIALYVWIALIGTVWPNMALFTAAVHVPAGVLALALALVPILSLPMAVLCRTDHFSIWRAVGLILGLLGVFILFRPHINTVDVLLVPSWWLAVLVLAVPFFYAVEGVYIAKYGTQGLDIIELMVGVSVCGVLLSLPLAIVSNQWIDPLPPYNVADFAVFASGFSHAFLYTLYLWLVRKVGVVFASQTAYLVTCSGILWSMLLLSERYTNEFWIALLVILLGVTLVRPRTETNSETSALRPALPPKSKGV